MNPEVQSKYLGLINNLGQIPTLPTVVFEILKIMNHPNSDAQQAAAVIENDVALTSRVLKLANSSYHGIPHTISNIQSAIALLGFNTIKTMVLSSSALKTLPQSGLTPGFNYKQFWNHSVEVAIISRFLARSGLGALDPELAFTAGLLHDIGKLVFDQYASEDWGIAVQQASLQKQHLSDLESSILGLNHAQLSSLLLEHWGIPESLQTPVQNHLTPDKGGHCSPLAFVIHFANHLSHLHGSFTVEGEKVPDLHPKSLEAIGIKTTPEEMLHLVKEELEYASEFIHLIHSD